ncbi:MAG: outer membrane protein assembly factor BamD [Gammaproteobacteria bacterium]
MQTRNKHYFIFNLLFLLILMGLSASCANKEETIERILLEKELFDQAQNRLRSGNFAAAAMSLEMLEARYPFGRFATQAQSELIYAYFKSANYEEPKDTLVSFWKFLLRFPDSDYADQARQRMVFLRNLIAKKEIYVATFYMERKAFVAALNRANYVIEHLPNSSQVEQALEIKIEAYKELNQSDLANITQDLLDAFKEKKIKS